MKGALAGLPLFTLPLIVLLSLAMEENSRTYTPVKKKKKGRAGGGLCYRLCVYSFVDENGHKGRRQQKFTAVSAGTIGSFLYSIYVFRPESMDAWRLSGSAALEFPSLFFFFVSFLFFCW